jgi:hypothetical protein
MTSINHRSAASSRGVAGANHVGVSIPNLFQHLKVDHVGGGEMNYPVDSQVVLHQNSEDNVYTASNVDGALSGGFADIEIKGATQSWKALTLEVLLTNSTGVNQIIPANGMACLDRVEIHAEGGGTLVQTIRAEQLWWPLRHLPAETYTNQVSQGFISTGSLVAGSSHTYYIPITNCLSTNQVWGGGFTSPITLRVYFRGDSAFELVTPTLTSLKAILMQNAMDTKEREYLNKRAKISSLDYRFPSEGMQTFSQTLAASTSYNFSLTSVKGLVTSMQIWIKNAATAGDWVFEEIDSYSLKNAAGNKMLGSNSINHKYQHYVKEAQSANNGLVGIEVGGPRVVFIDFGHAGVDRETGSITGYVPFSGGEQLSLTTAAGLAGGTYEIRVDYTVAARLNVNKGSISVFTS